MTTMATSKTATAENDIEREKVKRKIKGKEKQLIVRMNQEMLDLIDDLTEYSGLGNRAEFLRNLVRYAAVTRDELESGYVTLLRDQKGNTLKSSSHKLIFTR